MQDLRRQTEVGRNSDLEYSMLVAGQLDQMLGADMRLFSLATKISPRQSRLTQDSAFATESTSALGLVLREAGPVVPSTFEVVRTKVA